MSTSVVDSRTAIHHRQPATSRQTTSVGDTAGMPFTVSHIAAVVPIARRPFSIPALVCGAMAPDLVYYQALPASASVTHSLPGILIADVPLALLMLAAYYGLLARPLAAFTPDRYRHLFGQHGRRRVMSRPCSRSSCWPSWRSHTTGPSTRWRR
jgi:Domain of unknown function (DUF4184)